ncbi:hypothetical protein MAM1_0564d10927 [Mucor ambiguus]|uniref:Uncharacterized protein n=1 Tax=Mucor ambiguus TaxID=91626 RepID=A0A0C9N9G4_9FUNG|nr:hypothetical protein MAM1_0564d10927 [Mucor ambiguus]
MVQRPEQVNYLTSLLQWISKSPSQTTQQRQEQRSHTASKNATDKNNHANPRQHLMLSRQLKRHRRGEKRYGRNLPDCDQEEINQHFIESDTPLS